MKITIIDDFEVGLRPQAMSRTHITLFSSLNGSIRSMGLFITFLLISKQDQREERLHEHTGLSVTLFPKTVVMTHTHTAAKKVQSWITKMLFCIGLYLILNVMMAFPGLEQITNLDYMFSQALKIKYYSFEILKS